MATGRSPNFSTYGWTEVPGMVTAHKPLLTRRAHADGLLRTLQRRVRDWRVAAAKKLVFGPLADGEGERSRVAVAVAETVSSSRAHGSLVIT